MHHHGAGGALARGPIPAEPLTELTLRRYWKIDAPAQLSNIVSFFPRREARSISPSKAFLRPSEILTKPSVRHRSFPGAFIGSLAVESVAIYKFS